MRELEMELQIGLDERYANDKIFQVAGSSRLTDNEHLDQFSEVYLETGGEAHEAYGSHDDTIGRYEENADFCLLTRSSSLSLHDSDIHRKDWNKQMLVMKENEVQALSKLDNTKKVIEELIQKA